MAKSQEKIEARQLRAKGKSIKEIARILGVSVSSVSFWCRDIALTEDQIKILEKNAHDPFYGKRLNNLKRIQEKKLQRITKLKNEGIKEIGKLKKRELFLTGVALYWAEGFKKDSQAGFANSNPGMIKLYLRWLTECFGYKFDDLLPRVTVNESHQYRIKEIQAYWSDITGIPEEYFRKPFYQKVKWKKIYENPGEYYGVIRIKVRKSTDFLRKIHGWIEGLSLQAQ